MFPLKVSAEKSGKKKVYWSDIQISSSSASSSASSSSATSSSAKASEEKVAPPSEEESHRAAERALQAAASSAVQQFTVGSVNPVEELTSVMAVISLMGGGDNISPGELALGYPIEPGTGSGVGSGLGTGVESSSGFVEKQDRTGGDGWVKVDINGASSLLVQAAKRELVSQAFSVMLEVIHKLVTAGGSAAYHRKALGCLEVSDSFLFHSYVR